MANFPTSIDSYTTKADGVDYPAASHINEPQSAIVALETKVGVDSSAVTTSHDYKLSGVTGTDKAVSKTGAETLTNKTLTSPKVGTALTDTNGNEIIKTPATASAINEVTITNAALGGTPSIGATGDDTHIHLALAGKGNGLVKLSVLTQDADSANSYVTNQVILTGWGSVIGDGSNQYTGTDTPTFGITFSSAPIVYVSVIGTRTSTPTLISDFSNSSNGYFASCWGISTTGFSVNAYRAIGAIGATTRVGYSWIAIGTLN